MNVRRGSRRDVRDRQREADFILTAIQRHSSRPGAIGVARTGHLGSSCERRLERASAVAR